MRIIDAHTHVGLSGYNAETIIRYMDKQGIDYSWLLTWEELFPPVDQLHMDLPPEPLLEAFDSYPDRFIPFYAPDPAHQELSRRFRKYTDLGIKGCGELKVSRKWSEPLIGDYLETVRKYKLPLVFHMEDPRMYYVQEKDGFLEWGLERLLNDKFNGISRYYLLRIAESTGILRKKIRRNQVPFPGILYDFDSLEKRVQQFPELCFIGHGPDFWNHIGKYRQLKYIHQRGAIREFGIIDGLLEKYDNFYCDISGHSGFNALKRDPEKGKIFLLKHSRKILYGSDNTGLPLMELLRSMKLGKDAMRQILGENAMRAIL